MEGKTSPRYYPLDGEEIGEVDYYLAQLLSGNGYYLFKMEKMTRLNCTYGDGSIDDAEHTFIHCEAARKIGIAWPVIPRPC